MDRAATFDGTGLYRYRLDRRWKIEEEKRVTFVMLNPSTADASKEDPTIRRCMGFAQRMSFSVMTVVNLFAVRATNPEMIRLTADPVGPANDFYIRQACQASMMVICAWGAYPHLDGRDHNAWPNIRPFCSNVYCYGLTKKGAPKHPLYLPGDSELLPFTPAT